MTTFADSLTSHCQICEDEILFTSWCSECGNVRCELCAKHCSRFGHCPCHESFELEKRERAHD